MTAPLRVLMYHRVGERGSPASCDPSTISASTADFAWQMRHLARRYHVVGATDVVAAVRYRGSLPPRAVWLTFDDAYRDFAEVAWPILRQLGLPATLFVPTAFPDNPGRTFWWDRLARAVLVTDRDAVGAGPLGTLALAGAMARRAALRRLQRLLKRLPHRDAMRLVDDVCRALDVPDTVSGDVLSWSELRRLSSEGVTVAPHTRTHPALTRLTLDEAREEIRESREKVVAELGHCLPVFAYPFGECSDAVAGLVRSEGFELAVSCRAGLTHLHAEDPLLMRRANVTRRTTRPIFALRLTSTGARLDRWRLRDRERSTLTLSRAAPDIPRVAYIMSRFPKLSETFVLNEMRALAALGVPIEVFPLRRARQAVTHPEVRDWIRRAHFHPFVSIPILAAHVRFLRRAPSTYVRTLAEVLAGTWGSPKFFLGALGIFPKAVRFAEEMQRCGVNHIHAHFATHPAVAAFIAHRLTGIPFSFTAHGSDLHVDRRMLDRKLEAAAFAVAISAFNKDVMVRACGDHLRDRIAVVHCGVDTDFFCPPATRPRGEALRFICVASLEEVKGHRYLLEACATLTARGVDWHCDLVGEGPLRRAIEAQIARDGLDARVHLLGPQPRGEVARRLGAAHVAVLASHPTRDGRREGIPVALMEAMAAGLPVVATAISGIPELVDPDVTGLLVPSGDAAALADALTRLAGDPALRQRMGGAGRAKILASFDQRGTALELRRLFCRSAVRFAQAAEQPALSAMGAA